MLELDLSNTARNLIEDRFDLAIRGTVAVEPNLITRKLGEAALLLVASPAYLARRGLPMVPDDLAGHDLLHFSQWRRGQLWSLERGTLRVDVPVAPRLELSDGWALRTTALDGAGITLLPAFVVGQDLRSGQLTALLTEWSAGRVPLHAVYPDNRLVAQRVKAFFAFIARRARAEPDL